MSGQQSATGKLGTTPLVDLLVQLLDRRASGTLVIEDHRYLKSGLWVDGGAPAKARIPEPTHHLAEVLVATGAIAEGVAQQTLREAQATQRLHGQVLTAKGALDRQVLSSALGEQLARKVEWMAALKPESVYGFYAGKNYLEKFGGNEPAVVDPLAIIWRAARANLDAGRVQTLLRTLGGAPLRLHPAGRLARFGFDRSELAVVEVLRAKPMGLSDLLATGMLDRERLARQVYVLAVTRHFDLGDSGMLPVGATTSMAGMAAPASSRSFSPAGGTRAPVSTPAHSTRGRSGRPSAPGASRPPTSIRPSVRSGEAEAFRKEIDARLGQLDEQTHYEVLGLDKGAPGAALQSAFFALAKRWHPDRLPDSLADAKGDVTKIFARMSEAHQTLSSEQKRAEYDALLDSGVTSVEEREAVERALDAGNKIQRAEILLKRGEINTAATLAMEATEAEPENHLYRAIYADVLSQTQSRAGLGNYSDLLEWLQAARKAEPDNPRIRLARARVLKRSGDHDAAYKEFRQVLRVDEHNVEAKTEVRLYRTRQASGRTAPPTKSIVPPSAQQNGGLFGKLFKR